MKNENGGEPDNKKTLAEQKAVADSALEQFLEVYKSQQAFIKKNSLGKWGLFISFLAAVGVVLGCVFSPLRESGLIIPLCIVGFIIVFLVVEFLLVLIVDSALQARHKEERDRLRREVPDTRSKFNDEEKKYLEMWCDENYSKIYRVVIDEEVRKPNTVQIHAITRYTGCHAKSAESILRKQVRSDRMKLPREWAIIILIELLASEVKASLETCDNYC